MSKLQKTFESALKEYEGENEEVFSVDDVIAKLREELPNCFTMWMEDYNVLAPIAAINIEVDSGGYFYTSLMSEKGICMESEAATVELDELELTEVFEEDATLVVKFLAYCYEKVLPEICNTHEFLNLPRAAKIIFSVGEHSGWECENVYQFNGEQNVIDHGNVRLKTLAKATTCHTEPDKIERKFMDHLHTIDIEKCADELTPIFNDFSVWLTEQNPTPIDRIVIAWSSNFDAIPALGAYCETDVLHRYPISDDLYKWFSEERPDDLDEETSIRYCIGAKIAQIACVMMEKVEQLNTFKELPKHTDFIMRISNRTAGAPHQFYPFT